MILSPSYLLLSSSTCAAKIRYGTSLANVDWLHGGAESLLTLTNLFIVLGLRKALREPNEVTEQSHDIIEDENIVRYLILAPSHMEEIAAFHLLPVYFSTQ